MTTESYFEEWICLSCGVVTIDPQGWERLNELLAWGKCPECQQHEKEGGSDE